MKRIATIMFSIVLLSHVSFTQITKSKIDTTKFIKHRTIPLPHFPDSLNRPGITLQKALTLAEKYIESEHIDIKHYYLFEARMLFHDRSDGSIEEEWYFGWVNENHALGDCVDIGVSMKGKVRRFSSM